jgi:DNA-binding MarR family transcriptional regulator
MDNKRRQKAAGENERNVVMAATPSADQLVGILRDTIVALVRRDGPDLSARQLGVFLTCYLQDGAHTVRGLAADLNVSKPAITRALDRLGELDLARRKVDPMDRRSVLVQRTLKGTAFLRDLRGIMTEASTSAKKAGGGEGQASRRVASA